MQACNPGQSRFVAWSPVHKHPDSPPGQSKPLDQNGRCAEGRSGQEGLMIWLRLQLLLPCTSIPPEHRLRPNLSSCRMTLVGQLDYCPILSQEITFTRLNFRLKGEVHAHRASIGGWDKLHQRLSTRALNIILVLLSAATAFLLQNSKKCSNTCNLDFWVGWDVGYLSKICGSLGWDRTGGREWNGGRCSNRNDFSDLPQIICRTPIMPQLSLQTNYASQSYYPCAKYHLVWPTYYPVLSLFRFVSISSTHPIRRLVRSSVTDTFKFPLCWCWCFWTLTESW